MKQLPINVLLKLLRSVASRYLSIVLYCDDGFVDTTDYELIDILKKIGIKPTDSIDLSNLDQYL